MQSAMRPSQSQIYWVITTLIGVVTAALTIGTFYWVRELAAGTETREAQERASLSYYNATGGLNSFTATDVNGDPITFSPFDAITKAEPTEIWLGSENWAAGVQAGQNYIQQFPQPQNVQVLTGMTTQQIWTYMQQNVSAPLGVGCQYCHGGVDANGNINFGLEGGYPEYENKVSARNMLRLVNDLNAQFIVNLPEWKGNYVTCATCHAGTPVGAGGLAVGLPQHPQQFLVGTPPVPVFVADLTGEPDENGVPAPVYQEEPLLLGDAVLYYLYNYQVWKEYDPADPNSARGSLALTYEGGRTQEQVNINQSVMNYMGWSLGQGCTYCHNSRNFVSNEIIQKVKAQRMLLMTTWLNENWASYGAQPNADGSVNANVPGCFTCHAGQGVPLRSLNQTSIPTGDAGTVVMPPVLRGTQ